MDSSANADTTELAVLQARIAELERREQEWKATEQQLRNKLTIYQQVIDALPIRIFWKESQDLRYLGCNLSFAHDAGRRTPADLIDQDDYHMAWAPQAEAYRAGDRSVLASGIAQINYEEPQTREDGSTAWLRTSKVPLRRPDGTIFGVLGTYEDITADKQAEQERIAERDRLIAAQQDSLRELSTPLIPLTDHVVVMPLVGTIDTHRARQIMETLLAGLTRLRADFAILDISGVRVVDTQVANALLQTARASRLLGTQVMLTGISPEIAQTVVHLGADMHGVITMASLRDGIQYAARHQNM